MGQSGRGLRGSSSKDDEGENVKRQVDSDDNYQKPIYQLVNVKNGGGKLIDIIKSSARLSSSSFALSVNQRSSNESSGAQRLVDEAINEQIRSLVEPLLYNGGHGKLIPLSHIWMYRLGKQKNIEKLYQDNDVDVDSHDDDSTGRCRRVCWKLDERGFVGETALHICFLLSTPTHMILARKLLTMFPMLINDIYTCDGYYGESSLHMAIVNENVRIVKLLVDHGANVHERCLGSFFLPDDQKDKANGLIRKELDKVRTTESVPVHIDLNCNHFNSWKTNYDGYVYWGEYPLSFAACLGLADCYKLLLAKGADPNRQDSNGNSTLHMTVIANRLDMFDLCYSNGADLNITNNQNLTPLSLAAKLCRVEMFFHILTIQRQVSWIFCNVGFVEVPLAGVDSVNVHDGTCDDDSVLSIIVFATSTEHLRMLDGLLSQLLQIKWETSAKKEFLWWMYQYLIILVISFVAYVSRLIRDDEKSTIQLYLANCSEFCLVLYVVAYLCLIVARIVPSLGAKGLVRTLLRAPEASLFTVTCLSVLTCVPIRYFNWRQTEDFVAALIMFTMPLKLLFFCRASRSVGSFVVMIYKILVNDVLCFVVFLIIFVAGFSQSFFIIFKTHQPKNNGTITLGGSDTNNYFSNLFDGVIAMHMMALNEFGIVLDEFNSTDYPELAKVLFCIYMIIVSILLMNMLIAMLGKTYQDVASQPNENLRQWARAMLIVEQMATRRNRLSMLARYSHSKRQNQTNGLGPFYGSTWALNVGIILIFISNFELPLNANLKPFNKQSKDLEEITKLRELNEENKRNAARRIFTGWPECPQIVLT